MKILTAALCCIICGITNVYAENKFYLEAGTGVVIPGGNSSNTSNSSSVIFSPTAPGTSTFDLPNVNWQQHYQTGFNLNAAAGYIFNKRLRSDVEFLYQHFNRKISGTYGWRERAYPSGALYAENSGNPIAEAKSPINVYSLLINGYYDFNRIDNFIPQVGFGFGLAWVRSPIALKDSILNIDDPITPLVETARVLQVSPSIKDTVFAWQFKAALAYIATKNSTIGLQYRLFGTSSVTASGSVIETNPKVYGESDFKIASYKISRLLTNSLEIIFRFNL